MTEEVRQKIEELKRSADRNKIYEIGALGIGKHSSDYRHTMAIDIIFPRSIKLGKKELPDFPGMPELEYWSENNDIYATPNGMYYTKKYRQDVEQQGKIVLEIHSHLPLFCHFKDKTTDQENPSNEDINALRGYLIIPAGGIIHEKGVTFYHASQTPALVKDNQIISGDDLIEVLNAPFLKS